MRKYNLSNIMKRAWELVKKAGMTISSGLKKAWEEAKEVKKMRGSEKQIAWANDLIEKFNKEMGTCLGICPSEEKERFSEIVTGINALFENAYAGDVIDLLNRRSEGYQYYREICVAARITAIKFHQDVYKVIYRK